MRRAALLLVAALAGCGGDENAPGPADTAQAGPSPTPAVATPSPTPGPTATPKAEGTARPARPAPPSKPGRERGAGPITEGVRRYLVAVNDRDISALCAGFSAPTPAVCGGPGRHLPVQPVLESPAFARLIVTERPRLRRAGGRVRATVQMVVMDETGGREPRTEPLTLRRRDAAWAVTEPSPVFYRSINRQAP